MTLPQNITPSQTNYYHKHSQTLLTNFIFIPNKTNTQLYLNNIISNYQILITLQNNPSPTNNSTYSIYKNNNHINSFNNFYNLLNFFTNPNTSHITNPSLLTPSQINLLSQTLNSNQPSNILSFETTSNTPLFELQNYTKTYSLTINLSQNSTNYSITKYNSSNSHYLPITQTFPNLSQTIQHYSTLIS